MKPIAWLASCAALVVSADVYAVGTLANVQVIDRETGAALEAHFYRGAYWVAGTPGARYAIQIRNRDGGRVLAVTSVDGVNVVSGQPAGWQQSGYVFAPGEQYQIDGWRKSNAEVAAFTFTDPRNSYAQRTGRPDNIGVIGVAVFRERAQQWAHSAPVQPEVPRQRYDTSAQRGMALGSAAASAPAPVPGLGTGHGERESSYVVDTDFRRLQNEPNEVIHIRYDSIGHLVALGVISAPGTVPPVPNPFPAARPDGFVPDPPG